MRILSKRNVAGSQSRIAITGGAGFIFSHVVDFYLDKGWKVLCIDNLSEGSHPELLDGWKERGLIFHELNVADPKSALRVIEFEPDYIIHAAAYSDVDVSITDPASVMTNNILGNINMFEAARQLPNLKKFLYVSTDEVMGECEYPKKETEILFPKNPYSASKAAGSLIRMAYDNTYTELRNKTCETRFCNVIGDRQDARKILPRIIEALKTNKSMPVHNGGGGYREYIWVDNIPPVIDLILQKGDRVYNVTNNEGFTVNSLITKVEQITGKKVLTRVGERPGMDMKYQLDATRLRNLGWKPLITFEDGLKKYIKNSGLHG